MFSTALRMLLIWTFITGLLYPLAVTGVAQLAFPHQANGSMGPSGSELIGQNFSEPRYFWGRPSAIAKPYDASGSSGSNLGPTEPKQKEAMTAAAARFGEKPPVDLLTASGSGLDPHISPEAAEFQVARVAKARGLQEAQVRELVRRHVEGPTFSVLGAARVNVLLLNRDLDSAGR